MPSTRSSSRQTRSNTTNNKRASPTKEEEEEEEDRKTTATATSPPRTNKKIKPSNPLEGRVICFTGTLTYFTRAEATKLAIEAGATVVNTVTKKVQIVVAGPGAGAKVNKAQSQGCEIWTETQFQQHVQHDTKNEGQSPPPTTPKKKAPVATVAVTPSTPPPSSVKMGLGGHEAPNLTTNISVEVVDNGLSVLDEDLARRVAVANEKYLGKENPPFSARLALVDPSVNSDKYYILQILKVNDQEQYYVFSRWGRTGTAGQAKLDGPYPYLQDALDPFCKIFKSKVGVEWWESKPNMKPKSGKYAVMGQRTIAQRQKTGSWYYYLVDDTDGKPDGWYAYDSNNSHEVEELYSDYVATDHASHVESRFIFSESSGFSYHIHLRNMTQMNLSSGKTRPIQRTTNGQPPPLTTKEKEITPKEEEKQEEEARVPIPNTPVQKTKNTKAQKKTTAVPATPAPSGSKTRKVMSAVQNPQQYSVVGNYDVKLMYSDQVNMNSNKFYKLQLLQKVETGNYFVATNWGRLGEPGQSQLKGPHLERATGVSEFGKVFRSKTKNAWGANPFVRHSDKYQLVETTMEDDDDNNNGGGGGEQALGRLTENQIQKGQEVLQEIRTCLEATTKLSKSGRKLKDDNRSKQLGLLSNEFYSLIPTTSGRQKPPPLNNLEIVTEKEGLLEFWLRMGFEEVSNGDDDNGSPIEGLFDLQIPKTLLAAASAIADQCSIESSRQRGQELASDKAGNPISAMSGEMYAAILLYTGNSIYRDLNRCLRLDWQSVRKYWDYLRLYFAAVECMPKQTVTLWRGIAADLYEEYEPGKIITWWSVSSCTSDKSVAEDFMNQLGGGASSFLTLRTKTACDISGLSFFPHECESLLSPGTKLRVLKRSRKGKVAHIELEEVEG